MSAALPARAKGSKELAEQKIAGVGYAVGYPLRRRTSRDLDSAVALRGTEVLVVRHRTADLVGRVVHWRTAVRVRLDAFQIPHRVKLGRYPT